MDPKGRVLKTIEFSPRTWHQLRLRHAADAHPAVTGARRQQLAEGAGMPYRREEFQRPLVARRLYPVCEGGAYPNRRARRGIEIGGR